MVEQNKLNLNPYAPGNSDKLEKQQLKSTKTNSKNSKKNASKNASSGPRKFIGFNDFSAFDEMNTATYSKKEYEKLGLPPKLNENSRDFKLSPREIIHITNMKPYGDGNVDTYRKYQLSKENSRKNKASTEEERKQIYNKKKTEKYKELNEKCEKQNMANAQKRLDYEIKQKAKEEQQAMLKLEMGLQDEEEFESGLAVARAIWNSISFVKKKGSVYISQGKTDDKRDRIIIKYHTPFEACFDWADYYFSYGLG
jgi:hypothetical protein